MITSGGSRKVRTIAVVLAEPEAVRRAEEIYASRYRVPRPNPDRVAIKVAIDRFLMSGTLKL